MTTTRRKPAHWKGPRINATVRLPESIHAAVEARAAQAGVTLDAYLVRVIAGDVGLEAPAYCYPREAQLAS